jgi:hypothetical protein
MAGTVASPTPMLPMAAESTSVTASGRPGRARLAKASAVIQPAVPPPRISTRSVIVRSSEFAGGEALGARS